MNKIMQIDTYDEDGLCEMIQFEISEKLENWLKKNINEPLEIFLRRRINLEAQDIYDKDILEKLIINKYKKVET